MTDGSLVLQRVVAQFDKTSDACQFMKLVNVWGTASTESSVAYLVEHQAWVPALPMFCSVVTTFG